MDDGNPLSEFDDEAPPRRSPLAGLAASLTLVVPVVAVLALVFAWSVRAETRALAFALVVLVTATRYIRRKRARPFVLTAGLMAIGVFAWLLYGPLTRLPLEGKGVITSDDAGLRHRLGSVVPEVDQALFGLELARYFDPALPWERADLLRAHLIANYNELEQIPGGAEAGSPMLDGYRDLAGFAFDSDHAYVYTPSEASEPAPAIFFLHGEGGNFRAYLPVLVQIAERVGAVLVAPSYGFGKWPSPDGPRAIEAAWDEATQELPIDPEQTFLLALDRGGEAATRLFEPSRFRGIVFLSAHLDPAAVLGLTDREPPPILLIQGTDDRRVDPDFATAASHTLDEARLPHRLEKVEDGDHFLLMTARPWVVERVARFFSGEADELARAPRRVGRRRRR